MAASKRSIRRCDLAAAKALTEGLLLLSGSDGECVVEIFELPSM